MTAEFDIVIVGGGMVGAALACALQHTSLRIALVDAEGPFAKNDPRLIALNYGSISFFKNLKSHDTTVFELLKPYAAPIEHVHISKKGAFPKTRVSANEFNIPALGYVIPAKYINAVLMDAITNISNIHILKPANLISISQSNNDDNMSEVEIEQQNETYKIKTKWLVGADGTHSTVRKLSNIDTEIFDYQQSALVSRITLSRSHRGIAYERFVDTGAIAMLPLASENADEFQCAMIWTDQNEKLLNLKSKTSDEFITELQNQFGYQLGRLKTASSFSMFPLHLIKAQTRVKNKTILIGNAAHTLHPLLAQGLNVALHEVALLAQTFLSEDLASINLNSWNEFSISQKISIQLSHQLNKLFSNHSKSLSIASHFLMASADLFSLPKKWFAKPAIGLGSPIPQLFLDAG